MTDFRKPHTFTIALDESSAQAWCDLHPRHKGPHFGAGFWVDNEGNEVHAPSREQQAANCPHQSEPVEIPSEDLYITYRPSPCIYCHTAYHLLEFRNPDDF